MVRASVGQARSHISVLIFPFVPSSQPESADSDGQKQQRGGFGILVVIVHAVAFPRAPQHQGARSTHKAPHHMDES